MGRFKVSTRGKTTEDLDALPPNLVIREGSSPEQHQHPTILSHYGGHRGGVHGVKFRSNMKHLVSGGADGIVYLWSMHCRPNLRHPVVRPYRYVGHQGPVYAVAVSPLDSLVASASKDKSIRLWIPTVEGKCSVIKGHTGPVRTINFNPNGQWILSGSDDKTIKIWQVSNHKFVCALSGHMNWIRSAEFNGSCRQVVSGSDDRTVRLWDVETHHCIIQFPDVLGEVYTTRFHPDGSCVASGNSNHCIQMWDLRSKSLIQHYKANGGAVNSVCFDPSGNFLLSGCEDATLKIWDLRAGQIVYTLQGHDGGVRAAEFSPTGEFFASGSKDDHVVLWRTNVDLSYGRLGDSCGQIVKKNEVGHSNCSACNCVCTSRMDGQHPLDNHGNGSCVSPPQQQQQHQQHHQNSNSPPKSSQSRRPRLNSPTKSISSPLPPTPTKKHNADTTSESELEDFEEGGHTTNNTTKVNILKFQNKMEDPNIRLFDKQDHGDGMLGTNVAPMQRNPCKDFVCDLCEDSNKAYKDHYLPSIPSIHSVESSQAKIVNKVDNHGLIDSKNIGSTLEKILSQLSIFTQTFGLFEERLSHFENKLCLSDQLWKMGCAWHVRCTIPLPIMDWINVTYFSVQMIQMERRVEDLGSHNNGDAKLVNRRH